MKIFLSIILISGIMLIHAGSTVHCLLSDYACISFVMSAEEEEESHYSKKSSKAEYHCSFSFLDTFAVLNYTAITHKASILSNFEANRIDLPPEA